MFTSGSSQITQSSGVAHRERGMESPSLLFWRGEKWQEHFALPLLGDEGNLCAPRISQMSPRESWEVRVNVSASPARPLAASLSLIFIHACFPPGNFYQSIQPAQSLPAGTGPKPTRPPSSRRTGATVVLGWEGGLGAGGKAHDMRPSLVS